MQRRLYGTIGNDASMKKLFYLAAAVFAYDVSAATMTASVVTIHDGYTVTVVDAAKKQHKVRLAGIDAPDLKQAYGPQSKQNLSKLVLKKTVVVDWSTRDRNKRIIGKIMLDETGADCAFRSCIKSLDAGLQQIRDGFAWHNKQYEPEQSSEDRTRYAAAEAKAKTAKTGLWADEKPVPPWEWRAQRKKR